MNQDTERIRYLTKKAQRGAITQIEQDELATLLGRNPDEYQGQDGLALLIGVGLAAIAAAIIIAILGSASGKGSR